MGETLKQKRVNGCFSRDCWSVVHGEAINHGHAFPKGPNWRPRSKAQQNEDMISLVCYMRFFVIKKKRLF